MLEGWHGKILGAIQSYWKSECPMTPSLAPMRRPSTRNSVCLLSMPRRLSTLRPPMARPCRLTPGSARSASSRLSAPRVSISCRVTTLSAAGARFSSIRCRVAVTTTLGAASCALTTVEAATAATAGRQTRVRPASHRRGVPRGARRQGATFMGDGWMGAQAVDHRARRVSSTRPSRASLNCFGLHRERAGLVRRARRLARGVAKKRLPSYP